MECVILAGGLGTRMRAVSGALPKALIPVHGRPFVDIQLEWLAAQGVVRAVLSIGHQGHLIRSHVGDGRGFGLQIDYVDEGSELRGTAGALRLALEAGALPESFLLLYGDSYLAVTLRDVWQAFQAAGAPALMTVLRNEGRWDRSNARYADGRVELYDKFASEPASFGFIDYGLSVLARSVVEKHVPKDVVFDLASVFHELSITGRLAGLEVQDRFYEVGSPDGLADLEAHLSRSGRPDD